MANKRSSGSGKPDTLPWHLAFFDAIRLELFENLDDIEITFEHQLTSEPLRIDVLIVKKRKNAVIDKNIARIFCGHNIIEYKSPDDSFSVRDFLQVCAYANHYAANTPNVDDADLSLTFVGNRHPRALLQYLAEKRKYTVAQSSPGIYLIEGYYIPIQIIESKRLPKNESLWLKSLTNTLRADSARAILEASTDNRLRMYFGAYLNILFRSNRKIFAEAKNMARRYPTLEEALSEIYPEEFPRFVQQRREEEKEKIARNLLAESMTVDEIARAVELPVARVRALKKSKAGARNPA
ncbi:MAG: hypothetical protein LBC99_06305 [Spirochaetota bacterium]|jgi:hypothetical protein|nr:hypothetical protein [Spirochaetota bacterium]